MAQRSPSGSYIDGVIDPSSRLYFNGSNIDIVSARNKLSYWTLSLCVLRWSGAIAFQTWFWYRGLDAVNELQCMIPHIFWYGNMEASGLVRTRIKGGIIFGDVCVDIPAVVDQDRFILCLYT
jgi:hypothetical protein